MFGIAVTGMVQAHAAGGIGCIKGDADIGMRGIAPRNVDPAKNGLRIQRVSDQLDRRGQRLDGYFLRSRFVAALVDADQPDRPFLRIGKTFQSDAVGTYGRIGFILPSVFRKGIYSLHREQILVSRYRIGNQRATRKIGDGGIGDLSRRYTVLLRLGIVLYFRTTAQCKRPCNDD